jgi:hypothetical protein
MGKRYKYAISFEWPPDFREARILDEGLWLDGSAKVLKGSGVVCCLQP